MSTVGVVVGSNKINIVEGLKNKDGTVTLQKDEVLNLEKGDRHIAYCAMYNRIKDRMSHGVKKVILKASSAGKFTGSQAALQAAELRGVFISAVPENIPLIQEHVKNLSKVGSRKVSDYTKDDDWWDDHFTGPIRKGSREAAYLLISSE